jgi:hypothetical protein
MEIEPRRDQGWDELSFPRIAASVAVTPPMALPRTRADSWPSDGIVMKSLP